MRILSAFLELVFRVVTGLLLAATLAVALWLTCLSAWIAVAVTIAASFTFMPARVRGRTWIVERAIWLLSLMVGCAFLWEPIAEEVGERLEFLRQTKDREGPSSFTAVDLFAVYGLNAALAAGGWLVGFPEVAKETLLLTVRADGDARTWRSDFAMRSPKVRAALKHLIEAEARQGFTGTLPSETVSWSAYSPNVDSLRVALALNSPLYLRAASRKEAGRRWVDVEGSAEIAYPRHALVPLARLGNGDVLKLDEGLFWVLQQRGWLHPYVARWTWSMAVDDPRLSDLVTVERSPREERFNWVVLHVFR